MALSSCGPPLQHDILRNMSYPILTKRRMKMADEARRREGGRPLLRVVDTHPLRGGGGGGQKMFVYLKSASDFRPL